jgi:23S rRNA pseudouridine1911/1915/1917 synthase
MDDKKQKLNDGRMGLLVELKVNSGDCRLDTFMTQMLKRYSRGKIKSIIKSGYLKVNSETVVKPSKKIKTGDLITFLRPVPENEPPLPEIGIVFEDKNLLIIDKPGDLIIHPTTNVYSRTLTSWIKNEKDDIFTPAHRLDRETSGIVVCCKKGDISKNIKKKFFKREINKGYLAIVKGEILSEKWIRKSLINDEKSPIFIKMCVGESEQEASTYMIPVQVKNGNSIVLLIPETGRKHQLRVHMENNNSSIWGDKIYGVEPDIYLTFIKDGFTDEIERKITYKRQMLHNCYISFKDPINEKPISFFSYPPNDFQFCLNDLGLYLPPKEILKNLVEKEIEKLK